jgi:sugar lactone lactonase YvrE
MRCCTIIFAALAAAVCCGACAEPATTPATSTRPHLPMRHDGGAATAPQPASPIVIENALLGVSHDSPDKQASGEVEGYASAVSATPGETIQLFVNVDHDQNVRWDLYRVGYYGGLGSRLIASGAPRPVAVQAACPIDSQTGLIECAWAPAFDVTIAPDSVSGYYYFELVNDDGFGSRVPLIVREGTRRAAALVQASVTTWQAYNVWGGTSLYDNKVSKTAPYHRKRAYRVSFNRPYADQNALWLFLYIDRFLEHQGYDVAYTTNVDVDADPSVLTGRTAFVVAAHDEYWTVAERDALDQARDQGVSLAFLSANTGYWRIRLEPSSDGTPRRTVTCYKGHSDPISNAPDTTKLFRGAPFARPENALIGVAYRTWSKVPGFPYIVTNADHWIYEGTGVKNNDALASVVGSEWDGVTDNGHTPAGLEVVATAITINNDGAYVAGEADATLYYPTPTSLVFAAASIDWGNGLEQGQFPDPRIARMTDNVLHRAGLVAHEPPTRVAPQAVAPPAASGKVLAGTAVPGSSDGPALEAGFSGPVGLAAGPNGELYVADGANHAIRKLSPDGTISTLVDSASGALSMPMGVALDPSGVLYVSDSIRNRIVKVSPDGVVTSYAGGASGAADSSDPLSATFAGPRGLAIGPAGELYVADSGNGAIRRIDAAGVTTIATQLSWVSGVAAASDGSVYFSTIAHGQIGVVRDGEVHILANAAGEPGNLEGPAADARLQPGEGLIVEADRLLFADTENNRVRSLSLTDTPVVSTIFGDGNTAVDSNDATRTWLPRGIAKWDGGYAVADFAANRILWFKQSTASP